MNPIEIFRKKFLPGWAALAVFLLILARACIQSITIDEADTYVAWVNCADPRHWWPAANNHVLNSMLMRLSLMVFGASELTLRLPALIGAVIYLAACYRLCALLTERVALRIVIFLCLTVNPFILDHLVAARGYSLAMGFLMSAVAVAAGTGLTATALDESRIRRTCATASLLLGLSFVSNFSFAIAAGLTLAAIFLWMAIRSGVVANSASRWRSTGALLLWSAVPGLIVFLVFAVSVVLEWPKGQFVFGAKSAAQMWSGILNASMHKVNPHLVNPLLYPVVDGMKVLFVPVLGVLFALQAVSLGMGFRRMPEDLRRRITLGLLLSGVILFTFLLHWIAFRAFGILLPEKRTGLYFALFITVVIAIAATVRAPSRLSRVASGALVVTLGVLAGYFVCCLRLTYFQEWIWNCDTDRIYPVVAQHARKLGVRDVESHWKWVAALNYYRSASGENAFNEVYAPRTYSPEKKIYVLDFAAEQDFIREQQLEVVYHGEVSDAAVAVRDETKQVASAVPVTATIKNLTRPRASDFYPGERFEVVVSGPPGESVYLNARQGSKPESATRYGATDASGRFSLRGEMSDEHLGEWQESWWVGRHAAPQARFTVRPRPGSRVDAE